MWVTWLFVFFVIAMVVGPIMMLRPSPSVSKLANMRTRASQKGISVRMPSREKHVPGTQGPGLAGAIYSLALTPVLRKQSEGLGAWCLKRQSHDHEIHFHKRWDWEGNGKISDALKPAIILQLDELPESIEMLEFNITGVGVLWDERCRGAEPDAVVDAIHTLLKSIIEALESA